jgi:large repetitive protein
VITQADIDAGHFFNTATADSTESPPASDDEDVDLPQNAALSIVKAGTFVDGDADGFADVGETITYTFAVTNEGNVTLTNVTVTDTVGGVTIVGGPTTLDVGETDTTTFTGSYVITQADIDAGHFFNTATADSTESPPASDDEDVDLPQNAAIDVEKFVSIDGGATWLDADSAPGPTVLPGTNPQFKFEVTNTGNVTLTNVTLSDSDFDLDPGAGTTHTFGTLAVGDSAEFIFTGATFQSGQHTDTATITGTTPSDTDVTDTDDANYLGFVPVIVSGNPQFNFPADVDKIQPKLQGGSFELSATAYIYWDLFTSNTDLAQIDLDPASYGSDYAGFSVSIVKIWEDTGLKDAIYRVYVANETGSGINLANNTDIVHYDVIQSNGQDVLSQNKGLIDLVNSDPLIGRFNNFSNIENALTKDATDGFLTAPANTTPPLTSGADKVWSSTTESGTGTGETHVTYDVLAGNDALYGTNNTSDPSDSLTGNVGNDMIDGRAGADIVNGGANNDFLFGGLGNDILDGGTGNDRLFGSYGFDSLTGGAGADDFIVRKGDFDNIVDFDESQGDRIVVWVQSLDETGATTPHTVTYDQPSGTLSVDGAPVAHLDGNPTITTIGTNPTDDVFIT